MDKDINEFEKNDGINEMEGQEIPASEDGVREAEASAADEISDSTEQTQSPQTAHYTYPSVGNNGGLDPHAERTAEGGVPDYRTEHRNGTGDISYTAEKPKKKERKKRKGPSKAAVALLVTVGIIASMGFGVIGAHLYSTFDVTAVTDPGTSHSGGTVNPVVIHKTVDPVTTSSDGSALTYAEVQKLTGDSVVAINTEYKNVGLWQYVTSGAGSGVIISEDGYIITNNHVVARSDNSERYADKVTVVLENGDEYVAEVIGGDAKSDIAVIKIEPEGELVSATFADSDKLAVGEEVIAIGNPLGELSGTMTNGIISSLAREIEVDGVKMNLLQTNAAINPGNSGGGLFNMRGELIGIVNAKSSGTGIEGLGFAIPSNDALEKSTEIIEKGSVSSDEATTKIGITTVDIFTQENAAKYGVNAFGVYVAETEEGYNDKVLEAGDRIIAVDEREITSGTDVVEIVRASKPGDVLEFVLYRNGRLVHAKVTCYSASERNVEF